MKTAYNQRRLNQLLETRFHGAINIAGIRYQIAYSVFRAFDLYGADPPETIQLEAIEDLDVRGNKRWEIKKLKVSNQFVQVKTSKAPWDWGRFKTSGIIQNFLPVWSADPEAELLIVTNFSYRGGLDEFAKYCNEGRKAISNKVMKKLKAICEETEFPNVDPLQLAKRITFSHIREDELKGLIESIIVKKFDLSTPNAELYLSVLMTKFIDLAVQRGEVNRQDLESIKLFIQEQIDLGVQNPAVQGRWLERLEFSPDDHPEDYYEGKNARPGHVLAGMDVARPTWIGSIREVLKRSRVCIVRASSGQGKSTLLYRYAYEHYHPETTFIIKLLSEERMIGPIKQALIARQSLGLPILVLIDNVGNNLKYWSRLAAELAWKGVRFLVSIREEDWYRYSGNVSGFDWEIVTPMLSLMEARDIFTGFKKQGKIEANVRSAEWAYEKIADRKLLIEFTYLITHGQMLEERLREQVQAIDRLGEDPAKLEILRLVSVAQLYGARISNESLLKCIQFTRDPDLTLKSLDGEYIFQADRMYEGLHYVRSQHLVSLLHVITPMERTMSTLIKVLDQENIESFVSAVFTAPTINHTSLLTVLRERCLREPLEFANRIVMSLFTASELTYYRLHKYVFDSAFEQVGSGSIMMLCFSTLPFPKVNLLEELQQITKESIPNLTFLSAFAEQFALRQWDVRFEVKLLQYLTENIDASIFEENLSQIGTFLDWCRLPGVDPSRLVQILSTHDWQAQIYRSELKAAADLLISLHEHSPHAYQQLMASDKNLLMSYFKLASDTLLIEERGDDICIEFIVNDQESQNEQAVNRLRNLRKFFPGYQRYCSEGLFPSLLGAGLTFPTDTIKHMPRETMELELDAEKNRVHLRAVESEYAAESIFDWQEQWFTVRKELLNAVEHCIKTYEALFAQKRTNADKLIDTFNVVIHHSLHLKGLPFRLSERFEKEQAALSRWLGDVSNFLRQFTEHDPNDAEQQYCRLMKYNLKESIKNLGQAQRSLHLIADETQPYFPFLELDNLELKEYTTLSEIIDFWFVRPTGQVRDIRRAAAAHRQNMRAQFAETIRATMQPLEAEGFRFTYPNGPLENHPLTDICIGFEIEGFETQFYQLAKISSQLSSFPLEFHFLNLAPLVNGGLFTPTIMRIARDKMSDILNVQESQTVSDWPMLSVEPPEGFFEVLPVVKQASFGELELLGEFYSVYGSLNMCRNTVYFLKSRLDYNQSFEKKLAEKYQNRLQHELGELSIKRQDWVGKARKVAEDNPAASQWIRFYNICLSRLQGYDDLLEIEPESFQPINVFADIEVQSAFHKYMDAVVFPDNKTNIEASFQG